jgi:NAD(P)-dependent dehydrogenase (short-subunit alcohol dehydrogenase family)
MARTPKSTNSTKSTPAAAAGSKQTNAKVTAQTVEKQRRIQREQDDRDAARPKAKAKAASAEDKPAVQAGARQQPAPPLPSQHLRKPGLEADMELKPRFMAPDYKGSGKLLGKTALITGGDSGIGRAVAVLFAREGADVAIVYLHSQEDAEDTRMCVEAEGQSCLLLRGDVKDPKFCRQAVAETAKHFGQLDILVNNAAFQEHADSITDLTDERFEETFRTNIFGYFQMARAVLPHLEKAAQKSGNACIINTGSVTGLEGSAKLLDYSATKGAIHAFTKSLASNLIDKNIRVNAIAPGPVWTPLNPADKTPEDIAKFGQETDMKRPAQPEELSPAYVFLASPACSGYITGIVLPITGSVGA